jgi:hypothetical protein
VGRAGASIQRVGASDHLRPYGRDVERNAVPFGLGWIHQLSGKSKEKIHDEGRQSVRPVCRSARSEDEVD